MHTGKASGLNASDAREARRGDLLGGKITAEANPPPAKLQGRSRPSATKRTRADVLAEQLLRDRAERAARKAARPNTSVKVERDEFDPFKVTRWRVIAGGDPGYLVQTLMRRGPVGWFIACRACTREFESKGWAYCPDCMALPADERREQPKKVGHQCQGPGCGERLSVHARADARYCSATCRKAAERAKCDISGSGLPDTAPLEMSQIKGSETRIKRASLIGPKDFPINIVGGRRLPQEKSSPLGDVRARLRS